MAVLDLEESTDIPYNVELNEKWKKSFLLEGMINLSKTGARLGVVKLTDATTNKSVGRIQARRSDSVSCFNI